MKYTNTEGHEVSFYRDSDNNLQIAIRRRESGYDDRVKSITIPSKDANEFIRLVSELHQKAEFDGTFESGTFAY